jgi:hypothetical protein
MVPKKKLIIKTERRKIMETIKAKKTSEMSLVEAKGYRQVAVDFEVKNKKATMIIKDGWHGPELLEWHFITGDHLIDSTAKIMKDFSAFNLLDYEVDITELIMEAGVFFDALKEAEKKKKEEEAKVKRGEVYDSHPYIVALKPALEAKGHVVTIHLATKQEYVSSCFDISLIVDGDFFVQKDRHNWFEVSNRKYGEDKISRTTKSTKLGRWISVIEEVIESDRYRVERKNEEAKKKASAKEKLEATLGIEIEERSEWHSRHDRKGSGYATPYFCKKTDNAYDVGIKFVERSVTIDKESVNGFVLRNLPIITDMDKLKKIYELLVG